MTGDNLAEAETQANKKTRRSILNFEKLETDRNYYVFIFIMLGLFSTNSDRLISCKHQQTHFM